MAQSGSMSSDHTAWLPRTVLTGAVVYACRAYTHELIRQDHETVSVKKGTDVSALGPQKWKN